MVLGLEVGFLFQNFTSVNVWMERGCSWNQASLESMGYL